jgi:flagellar assembly factor FliW
MLVKTTRFGPITAGQKDILFFPSGLLGFESSRQWLLINDSDNPQVAWLQSVSDPQVALPVISPRKFSPDYKVIVSQRQLAPLRLRTSDRFFALCVVSKTGKTLTVNLKGPILLNLTAQLGVQVVLNENLPLALPLNQNVTGEVNKAA